MKEWGLTKQNKTPDRDAITQIVLLEIATVNRDNGYRSMKALLRDKYKIHVSYRFVMELLREIDPVGLEFRKRRKLKRRVYYAEGPDWQWCYDGHDKLQAFGFKLHACVDAWSGKIMWFKIWPGNSDPNDVARWFLEACLEHNGLLLYLLMQ